MTIYNNLNQSIRQQEIVSCEKLTDRRKQQQQENFWSNDYSIDNMIDNENANISSIDTKNRNRNRNNNDINNNRHSVYYLNLNSKRHRWNSFDESDDNKVRTSSFRTVSSSSSLGLINIFMLMFILILALVLPGTVVDASFTIKLEEPGEAHCFIIRVPLDQDSELSGNYDSWSEHEHMLAKGWIEKIRPKQDIDQGNRNWSIWSSHPELREDTFDLHIPKGSGGAYKICFMSEHDERVRQRLQQQRQKERREQIEQARKAKANEISVDADADEENKDTELLLDYEIEDDDEAYASEPVTVGFNIRVDPSDVIHAALSAGEQGPEGQRALDLMTQIKSIERSWKNLVDHFDFLRNREEYQIRLTDQIESRIVRWSIIEGIVVITMSIGQVLYWRKFFEQRRYL